MVLSKKKREWWETGFSAEAQAVFDLMDTDPAPALKTLMAAFIDSQVLSGSWPTIIDPGSGLLDVFQFYAMDTVGNAVLNWLGTSPVDADAILVNSPVFDAFDGITGDGVSSFINSNYSASIDGVNFDLDDAIMGVFCAENFDAGNANYLFGNNSIDDLWMDQVTLPRVDFRINSATNTALGSSLFQDNTLYSVMRVDSANQIGIIGVAETSGAVASTSEPDGSMSVLARNTGLHLNARVACFYAGGGVGFNVSNFESNLSTLITGAAALG